MGFLFKTGQSDCWLSGVEAKRLRKPIYASLRLLWRQCSDTLRMLDGKQLIIMGYAVKHCGISLNLNKPKTVAEYSHVGRAFYVRQSMFPLQLAFGIAHLLRSSNPAMSGNETLLPDLRTEPAVFDAMQTMYDFYDIADLVKQVSIK